MLTMPFGYEVSAGPNANATIMLDLTGPLPNGNRYNKMNDGVISGVVSGITQSIGIEVFVKNATPSFYSIRLSLDYDKSLVEPTGFSGSHYSKNGWIDEFSDLYGTYDTYHRGGPRYGTLNSDGYLVTLGFATISDVTDVEFTIGISKFEIQDTADNTDNIDTFNVDNIFIAFNHQNPFPPPTSSNPLPQTQIPIVRKNMLPGDLDGDGTVSVADFLIFTDNFGRTDGDTFNPNDLVEITAIPISTTVTVYDTITHYVTEAITITDLPRPRIIVEPGGWDMSVSDMRVLLEDVRDVFADRLLYPFDSHITVQYKSPEGPKVLYNRASDGSYIVWLEVREGYGQPVFQFAHEYGHLLSNYRDSSPYGQQVWFEESIAALASLFALKTLQTEWTNSGDPTSLYKAGHVGSYLNLEFGGISRPPNFAQWYRNNRTQLEANPHLRDKSDIVAVELLDIFDRYPNDAWNAVRYMNRGPTRNGRDFSLYLNDWRKRTPQRWQYIVEEIMSRFEIQRSNKSGSSAIFS